MKNYLLDGITDINMYEEVSSRMSHGEKVKIKINGNQQIVV
jgi:hypothetical protein